MVRLFRLMLVLFYIYIYIYSTNIPPIMIINRIYENQNLLSLWFVSFLVGLRTYQHPCTSFLIFAITWCSKQSTITQELYKRDYIHTVLVILNENPQCKSQTLRASYIRNVTAAATEADQYWHLYCPDCQNTLIYAHTTSRPIPTCDVSLGSLKLPAQEAGDFV